MQTYVKILSWLLVWVSIVILFTSWKSPTFTVQSLKEIVVSSQCGNGIREGDEACDDGNFRNTDDCSNACAIRHACDDEHLAAAPLWCSFEFTRNMYGCQESHLICTHVCGDGQLNQEIEECDDGNTIDTDFCSNTCQKSVCGDGVLQEGEQCDIAILWDQCGGWVLCNECECLKPKYCGDGKVNQNSEACDDANGLNSDGCSDLCFVCEQTILPNAPAWCSYETKYSQQDCPIQELVCADEACGNGLSKSLFPGCSCPSETIFTALQESCIIDPITELATCSQRATCIAKEALFTAPVGENDSINLETEVIGTEGSEQYIIQTLTQHITKIMASSLSVTGKRLMLKKLHKQLTSTLVVSPSIAKDFDSLVTQALESLEK